MKESSSSFLRQREQATARADEANEGKLFELSPPAGTSDEAATWLTRHNYLGLWTLISILLNKNYEYPNIYIETIYQVIITSHSLEVKEKQIISIAYYFMQCVIAIISVTYKHLCIKLKMHSCLRIYQDRSFEGV